MEAFDVEPNLQIELLVHYNPGFVFLSLFIVVIGSAATIELLLLKRPGKGNRNKATLVLSGSLFAVSAFAMHFVGNLAIELVYPPPNLLNWQPRALSYSPGVTIASLFVSVFSMIAAFSFIGLSTKSTIPNFLRVLLGLEQKIEDEEEDDLDFDTIDTVQSSKSKATATRLRASAVIKIMVAGTLAGLGIASMHYLSQHAINDLSRVDNVGWIVLTSILVSVTVVTASLYLLFVVLRPRLNIKWWTKGIISLVLGAGIDAMHYTADLGTRYFVSVESMEIERPTSSRRLIIALLSTFIPLTTIALVFFFVRSQRRNIKVAASRSELTLKLMLFDRHGNLIVNTDGILPTATLQIHKSLSLPPLSTTPLRDYYTRRSSLRQSDQMVRSDPTFIGLLRASWSWKSGSCRHVEEDTLLQESIDAFESSARALAMRTFGSEDLGAMGVLFDDLLSTGHQKFTTSITGDSLITTGQIISLTRRITKVESTALLARGYMLAESKKVAKNCAIALGSSFEVFHEFLRKIYIHKYTINPRVEFSKIYASVLIVQALPGEGLQIVADELNKNSIPKLPLLTIESTSSLSPSHITYTQARLAVQALSGISLLDLINSKEEALLPSTSKEEDILRSQIVTSFLAYLDSLFSEKSMMYLIPRLILMNELVTKQNDSYLFCFKAIVPAHIELDLSFTPFPLFQAQLESNYRYNKSLPIGAVDSTPSGSSPASSFTTSRRVERRPNCSEPKKDYSETWVISLIRTAATNPLKPWQDDGIHIEDEEKLEKEKQKEEKEEC